MTLSLRVPLNPPFPAEEPNRIIVPAGIRFDIRSEEDPPLNLPDDPYYPHRSSFVLVGRGDFNLQCSPGYGHLGSYVQIVPSAGPGVLLPLDVQVDVNHARFSLSENLRVVHLRLTTRRISGADEPSPSVWLSEV